MTENRMGTYDPHNGGVAPNDGTPEMSRRADDAYVRAIVGTTDTKTLEAPKGFPNTEALSPAGLKQADISVVTAPAQKAASPVQKALAELAAAQKEQEEATKAEGAARQAHVEAQRRSGRAEQMVALAHRGYDLALQQARRAGIDPAEKQDGTGRRDAI